MPWKKQKKITIVRKRVGGQCTLPFQGGFPLLLYNVLHLFLEVCTVVPARSDSSGDQNERAAAIYTKSGVRSDTSFCLAGHARIMTVSALMVGPGPVMAAALVETAMDAQLDVCAGVPSR